jgi:hypothetical protein
VSAGKSTLINALLRRPVAPADAGECTRLVTWYEHGERDGVVLVELADGTVLRRALDGGRVPADLGVAAEDVVRLRVQLADPALRALTVIDTPGVNTVTAENEDATRRLLFGDAAAEHAQALLYVLRHVQRFDADTLAEFRDLSAACGMTAVNTAAVLTQIDRRSDADDPWPTARRLAATAEAGLGGRVLDVVPVIGLLAETAAPPGWAPTTSPGCASWPRCPPTSWTTCCWTSTSSPAPTGRCGGRWTWPSAAAWSRCCTATACGWPPSGCATAPTSGPPSCTAPSPRRRVRRRRHPRRGDRRLGHRRRRRRSRPHPHPRRRARPLRPPRRPAQGVRRRGPAARPRPRRGRRRLGPEDRALLAELADAVDEHRPVAAGLRGLRILAACAAVGRGQLQLDEAMTAELMRLARFDDPAAGLGLPVTATAADVVAAAAQASRRWRRVLQFAGPGVGAQRARDVLGALEDIAAAHATAAPAPVAPSGAAPAQPPEAADRAGVHDMTALLAGVAPAGGSTRAVPLRAGLQVAQLGERERAVVAALRAPAPDAHAVVGLPADAPEPEVRAAAAALAGSFRVLLHRPGADRRAVQDACAALEAIATGAAPGTGGA